MRLMKEIHGLMFELPDEQKEQPYATQTSQIYSFKVGKGGKKSVA